MYTKYFFCLLFSALLLTTAAVAQSAKRTITGTVTTEGVPLEGVQVLIKGSNYFSGTQQDGVFYIPVSVSDSVLVFSLEGYQPWELTLSVKNEYTIELKKKSPSIHEAFTPSLLPASKLWYACPRNQVLTSH